MLSLFQFQGFLNKLLKIQFHREMLAENENRTFKGFLLLLSFSWKYSGWNEGNGGRIPVALCLFPESQEEGERLLPSTRLTSLLSQP